MALGFIHFDRGSSKNTSCEILVTRDKASELQRNRYVKITNPADEGGARNSFLGRILEGPYFRPEEVSADSAIAQTPILEGERFPVVPNYYAVGGIEILGQMSEDGVIGCNTRPAPKAEVDLLTGDELKHLLRIRGEMIFGLVDGYSDLQLALDANDKSVLPRNVGIFGTVGSGKTNTAQVLIEEAAAQNWAVIVVDVEGEYIRMDEPTTQLSGRLDEFGLKPEGLPKANFSVYAPSAAETNRSDAKRFTLRIADLDPLVITELIEAAEAQERRLLEVIDWLRHEWEKKKKEGPPTTIAGTLNAKGVDDVPYTLKKIVETIDEWAFVGKPSSAKGGSKPASGADLYSYLALKGKLNGLARSGAFDTPGLDPIQPKELVQSGRVTVFDVSFANDRLKNLVIAELLRSVFEYKREHATSAPTMLMIEEAHTFISAEKAGRMQETIELLREIARRGRKRWLGLTFISQQPSHLPNEIFELCNTRIVHNVKSQNNLRVLKTTAGDVADEIWDLVPSLGTGQAVFSTPQYRDPVVVNMRPSRTKREFVD